MQFSAFLLTVLFLFVTLPVGTAGGRGEKQNHECEKNYARTFCGRSGTVLAQPEMEKRRSPL